MKKNLLTVVTLVLVLVNLVLTLLITMTIVPEVKQANALITKICSAIDLDLESGSATSNANIPVEQIELVEIGEENMTINLKPDGDGKTHVALIKVTLSLNNTAEDFDDVKAQTEAKKKLIEGKIFDIVSSYTMDELQGNQAAVREDLLENLQQMFGTDTIIDVTFSSVQYQ
ncbi:MAG: flagellar basal body-associated FliL family protein [Lachnospiraceae bacterium]|nr:flagellar basal body-associated FliL family protein [Lachnospiraceae bacterium]